MSDGECTTDALPTPPRDRKTYSRTDDKRKTKILENDDNNEKTFKVPPQNQAVVQVIHISNSEKVHVGNNNVIYNGTRETTNNSPPKQRNHCPPFVETEKIRSLKNSTKAVIRDDITLISSHMGEGWRDTIRSLGYKESEIHHYEYKYRDNLKEIIHAILMDWIQNNGPKKASVGLLAQTLWDNKEREAVKYWSEKFEKIHG